MEMQERSSSESRDLSQSIIDYVDIFLDNSKWSEFSESDFSEHTKAADRVTYGPSDDSLAIAISATDSEHWPRLSSSSSDPKTAGNKYKDESYLSPMYLMESTDAQSISLENLVFKHEAYIHQSPKKKNTSSIQTENIPLDWRTSKESTQDQHSVLSAELLEPASSRGANEPMIEPEDENAPDFTPDVTPDDYEENFNPFQRTPTFMQAEALIPARNKIQTKAKSQKVSKQKESKNYIVPPKLDLNQLLRNNSPMTAISTEVSEFKKFINMTKEMDSQFDNSAYDDIEEHPRHRHRGKTNVQVDGHRCFDRIMITTETTMSEQPWSGSSNNSLKRRRRHLRRKRFENLRSSSTSTEEGWFKKKKRTTKKKGKNSERSKKEKELKKLNANENAEITNELGAQTSQEDMNASMNSSSNDLLGEEINVQAKKGPKVSSKIPKEDIANKNLNEIKESVDNRHGQNQERIIRNENALPVQPMVQQPVQQPVQQLTIVESHELPNEQSYVRSYIIPNEEQSSTGVAANKEKQIAADLVRNQTKSDKNDSENGKISQKMSSEIEFEEMYIQLDRDLELNTDWKNEKVQQKNPKISDPSTNEFIISFTSSPASPAEEANEGRKQISILDDSPLTDESRRSTSSKGLIWVPGTNGYPDRGSQNSRNKVKTIQDGDKFNIINSNVSSLSNASGQFALRLPSPGFSDVSSRSLAYCPTYHSVKTNKPDVSHGTKRKFMQGRSTICGPSDLPFELKLKRFTASSDDSLFKTGNSIKSSPGDILHWGTLRKNDKRPPPIIEEKQQTEETCSENSSTCVRDIRESFVDSAMLPRQSESTVEESLASSGISSTRLQEENFEALDLGCMAFNYKAPRMTRSNRIGVILHIRDAAIRGINRSSGELVANPGYSVHRMWIIFTTKDEVHRRLQAGLPVTYNPMIERMIADWESGYGVRNIATSGVANAAGKSVGRIAAKGKTNRGPKTVPKRGSTDVARDVTREVPRYVARKVPRDVARKVPREVPSKEQEEPKPAKADTREKKSLQPIRSHRWSANSVKLQRTPGKERKKMPGAHGREASPSFDAAIKTSIKERRDKLGIN